MTNPNDPANPCKWTGNLAGIVEMPGLTKREYFAAMAMNGLLSGSKRLQDSDKDKSCSEISVEYADALIRELSKPSVHGPGSGCKCTACETWG